VSCPGEHAEPSAQVVFTVKVTVGGPLPGLLMTTRCGNISGVGWFGRTGLWTGSLSRSTDQYSQPTFVLYLMSASHRDRHLPPRHVLPASHADSSPHPDPSG